MDFTNGEILAPGSGLSLRFQLGSAHRRPAPPAISGLLNCGEGDKPKLHLQDFAFGEIHLAVTSIEVATIAQRQLKIFPAFFERSGRKGLFRRYGHLSLD